MPQNPAGSPAVPAAQPPQPAPPPRVYIMFTAEIVPQTVEGLIQALSNLAQKGIPEVYLAMSSPGGNVASGITLLQLLARRASRECSAS